MTVASVSIGADGTIITLATVLKVSSQIRPVILIFTNTVAAASHVVSGAKSTLKLGGVFQHFSYFFANFKKWGV